MTTEELRAELERLISVVDHTRQKLEDCRAEFEDSYPSACGEWWEVYDDSQSKLLDFWGEHRDKIGFVVWNHDSAIPESVIAAWPNEGEATNGE